MLEVCSNWKNQIWEFGDIHALFESWHVVRIVNVLVGPGCQYKRLQSRGKNPMITDERSANKHCDACVVEAQGRRPCIMRNIQGLHFLLL